MLARLQSHTATRAQPRPLRPRLQDLDALPQTHLAHGQRAALRRLPRGAARRLHRLRPHHPQLRLPADRHLRVCARGTSVGETRRAAEERGGDAGGRRGVGGVRRRRDEAHDDAEWVARVCEFELGDGYVFV